MLVDHARFPLDLLKTGIDSLNLPRSTVELLRIFRDLCSTVWMLHSRDKLTLAVRRYQASRERSLRVKVEYKPRRPFCISTNILLIATTSNIEVRCILSATASYTKDERSLVFCLLEQNPFKFHICCSLLH